MHVTPEAEWRRLLEAIDSSVIEVLTHEFDAVIEGNKKPEKQSNMQVQDVQDAQALAIPEMTDDKDKETAFSEKGFKRNKDGSWWVQVGWRNFKATAVEGLHDMERAVDLHTALTTARNSAMARYRHDLAELKKLGVEQKQITGFEMDCCPVITEGELLGLLQVEPYILLSFSSDLIHPKRIQSPWASYQKTMSFRMMIRLVQTWSLQYEQKLRDTMKEQSKEDKAERFSARCRAVVLVKEVAAQRNEQRIREKPSRAASAIEASQEDAAKPLALMETAFSEMQMLKAGMEEMTVQMRALDESRQKSEVKREESEAAWQSRTKDMEARHQQELRSAREKDAEEVIRMKDSLCDERSKLQDERARNMEQLERDRQRDANDRLRDQNMQLLEQTEKMQREKMQLLEQQNMQAQAKASNPFISHTSPLFRGRSVGASYQRDGDEKAQKERMIEETILAATRQQRRQLAADSSRGREPRGLAESRNPAPESLEPAGHYGPSEPLRHVPPRRDVAPTMLEPPGSYGPSGSAARIQ